MGIGCSGGPANAPFIFFCLLIICCPTVKSECRVQLCSRQYTAALEEENVAQGANFRYCALLQSYASCVRATGRSCRGDLAYHTVQSLVVKWTRMYGCESVMERGPQSTAPANGGRTQHKRPPRPHLECSNYRVAGDSYAHCGLFGDPHLRTFYDELQTCSVSGAWPLLDNPHLAVQVTNEPVGKGSSATAITKVSSSPLFSPTSRRHWWIGNSSFMSSSDIKPSLTAENAGKTSEHDSSKISPQNKVVTSFIAGAIAGGLAKSTIAPFDRTKINFQITNKVYTMKGAFHFIRHSYQTSGLLSLWRGNSATMARIVPYASIQFGAHERWKQVLGVVTHEERKANPGKSFLAGSLAGVVSTTCTYPLDLARARMAVTHKEMYNSLRQVFWKTWKTEGFCTLFRGYTPTVLGVIPYSGTSFFTYETLKRLHSEKTNNKPLHPVDRLVFGAVAGLLGQSSSYPFDIVRRRMQTSSITGSAYNTIRSTIYIIVREEGVIKGLYKGLSLNWIKGPIAVGISFTTFDITQNFLQNLYAYFI